MTDSPFAQPSSGGDKFEPGDFNGCLLLFFPKSYNPSETTKFGASTSADVDVIVVDRRDATGQPVIKWNARVFGNLANSVRDSIGSCVLARLGQGPNTKGNPPWILLAHTPEDAMTAGPVHAAFVAGQFKQPERPQNAPAAAPLAQDPWAGMNVQGTHAPQAPYVAPAVQTPLPAAPPVDATAVGDPNIVLLISKGIDPAKVMAMDAATRQMIAATF